MVLINIILDVVGDLTKRQTLDELKKCISFVHGHNFLPTAATSTNRQRALWVCRKGRSSSNKSIDNGSQAKGRGRSRASKRASLYDAMKIYGDHFQMLLEQELAAEQASFQEMQRAGNGFNKNGETRTATSASSLPTLVAVRKPRVYSNDVYTIIVQERSPKLWLDFSKGDLVNIFPLHRYSAHAASGNVDEDEEKVQSMVMSKTVNVLTVTCPLGSEASNLLRLYALQEMPLRIERGTNALAYERSINALNELTKQGPGTSVLARLMVTSFRYLASSTEGLRAVLYSASLSSPHDVYGVHHNGGESKDDEGIDEHGFDSTWEVMAAERIKGITPQKVALAMRVLPENFNNSQRSAVRTALNRTLTLIQGPPGTGKTAVAAAIIWCASQLGLGPILATTASNVAADNLMRRILSFCRSSTSDTHNKNTEKASDSALCTVVRYGRASAVSDDLWAFTVDAQLELDSAVCKARSALEAEFNDRGMDMLIKTERAATTRVLNAAKIVVATCIGSGSPELNERKFAFVLVDEATQATEPDTILPLHRDSVRQVVLVGDHHQLPPTTTTGKKGTEVNIGLETSLFQRLWACQIRTLLLNVQYRMHPQISAFPNAHFYKRRLRDGVKPHQRPLAVPLHVLIEDFQTGFYTRNTTPGFAARKVTSADSIRTLLLDVLDGEERKSEINSKDSTSSSSFSLSNAREAEIVIQMTHSLTRQNGFNMTDISIISPYASQVRLIRERFAKRLLNVEVNTVDAFQGREQNVVIISSVRSNRDHRVGFLSDWRRLNVAITRAKVLLVVVCDKATVSSDPHWASWFSWIERNGIVVKLGQSATSGELTENDLCLRDG